MTAKTYSISAHGQTFTESSVREYTHAVVAKAAEGAAAEMGFAVKVVAMCGSLALAQKQAEKLGRTWKGYATVSVHPVTRG